MGQDPPRGAQVGRAGSSLLGRANPCWVHFAGQHASLVTVRQSRGRLRRQTRGPIAEASPREEGGTYMGIGHKVLFMNFRFAKTSQNLEGWPSAP